MFLFSFLKTFQVWKVSLRSKNLNHNSSNDDSIIIIFAVIKWKELIKSKVSFLFLIVSLVVT